MRIYVSSGWGNVTQQRMVTALRAKGHQVVDFHDYQPSNGGNYWRLKSGKESPFEDLFSPKKLEGLDDDLKRLRTTDAFVLVFPCGAGEHIELGVAIERNMKTAVVIKESTIWPEVPSLIGVKICRSIGEAISYLEGSKS